MTAACVKLQCVASLPDKICQYSNMHCPAEFDKLATVRTRQRPSCSNVQLEEAQQTAYTCTRIVATVYILVL